MNTKLCGALSAATFAIALPYSIPAQSDEICSLATLKGNYAFVVSGQLFNAGGSTLRQGVSKTTFDGRGNLTQVDSMTGFHIDETGTYVVNPDCTGSAVINFPAPPVPGATGAVIHLMFVLSNHGRAIHTVVSLLTPPSPPSPLGAYLGASIHSDGWKIDGHEHAVDR